MPTNLDAYDQHCIELIAEHGWMIQGVFPREYDEEAPFAYTVGLTVAGLPELVISGLPADLAHQLLNAAAHASLASELRPGQMLDGIASVVFHVMEAPKAAVNMARHLYPNKRVRSLQLVWPDEGGNYPGDDGWSLDDAQPVYA
jgi:hypothetical protein